MFDIKALFLRAMLALTMLGAVPAALANPVYYHVTIDTAQWAGSTGWLDFGFNGPGDPGAGARVDGLSGDFTSELKLAGDTAGNVLDGFTLGNQTGYNFIDQGVNFGGLFSFRVALEDFGGDNGMLFSVALFNEDFSSYLGAAADLLTIERVPGLADTVEVPGQGVSVSAVPEPADWLLVASGLLLIGLTRREAARR